MNQTNRSRSKLALWVLPLAVLSLSAHAANVCTYNDATASFGASYAQNQESSQTAVACTAGSPTTAARLNNTSYARSVISAPNAGDFKFLQKVTTANSTPPSFEMVSGVGKETQQFPDSNVKVPTVGAGCDDTSAAGTGGVDAIERHLHRPITDPARVASNGTPFPLFGQTYYYGDYNANPPNDPATVTTVASPYGKWAPYNPAQDFHYYDPTAGKWGPSQGSGGTGGAYPIQVSGYADGCTNDGLTAAEVTKCHACITARGYYLHDGTTAGDLKKSVFHGNILNDYPPAWVHFAWAFGFILNFQLADASGNPILQMARDTAQSSNGSGSGCTTSNIQHTGGNFEPVGSSNCSIVYPTYNWTAVQALGLGPVYNDQSNVEGSNSAWGSDGNSASPAGDILSAGNWVSSFATNTCKYCQTKAVLYIGFGMPCGETRPAGLPAQTMAPCTGECAYVNPACTCGTAVNVMAEAAHYLWTSKNVRTYFIGMGPHTGAMRRAAAEGHGKYIDARDTQDFHDALMSVLTEVLNLATSSATSTLNAVQVSVAGQEEIVPRFVARQGVGNWEGHLLKYYLFSEFAATCTAANQTVPVPNPDQPVCTATCVCPGGACTATWLVDSQCKLITPDQTGFLAQATWNGSTLVPGIAAAVPVWDLNGVLQSGNWWQRNVYTAIDSNGDGKIDASDGLTSITSGASAGNLDLSGGITDAVADALIPYMGIDGTTTCGDIEAQLGTALPGTAAQRLRACTKVILNFALGEDLNNENLLAPTDSNYRIINRIDILGDIFHSSPENIGPPTSEADCSTNPRRCVVTLFNQVPTNGVTQGYQPLEFPTNVIDPATGNAVSNPGNVDAYQAYYLDETFAQRRPLAIAVGANDGMVHAVQTACFVNTKTVNGTVYPIYWDGPGVGGCISGSKANGTELWAFIPPDLLPKLGPMLVGKHQYFVDNSPMIRDIYAPAAGVTSTKRYNSSAKDFKRIAIFGEREGGTHWFALDVTDPTLPTFRWIFPQPNTEEELAVGQSWGDWVPNAPPVVPIRMAAPTGSCTGTCTFPTYADSNGNTPFQEKWVVLLPGGYDPYGVVGKHIYMLDAYTGAKIFQTNDTASIKQDFSFAALPAAVPWGKQAVDSGTPTYNNSFFDTAIYGDMGGQIWTLRFNDVGTGYPAGLVNNWYFGRSFRQYAADDTGVSPYKLQHRTPIFQMASAARLDSPIGGTLRAFIGTGDRANTSESGVGQCSIYNPQACGKLMCTTTMAENLSAAGNPSVSGVSSFKGDINATYATTWSETYSASTAACSPGYAEINACVDCSNGTGAGRKMATNASPSEPQYACTETSSGWRCALIPISETIASERLEANAGTPNPNPATDIGYYNRFLAFNVFDNAATNPRSLFTTSAGAGTYDGRALTESNLINLFAANASRTFSATGNTTVSAQTNGASAGFHFYYPVLDERTATNSVVSQNCVTWYSMEPGQECQVNSDCSGGTCNTTTHTCNAPVACGTTSSAVPARSAFLYQINATDGSTNCGLTSSNYIRIGAPLNAFLVPPSPPQQLVAINRNNQRQYSIVAPAGQLSPPASTSIGGASVPFSFFYTIEAPRELEICRHQYVANACNP